jgi:hypothetical protein
MRNLLDPRTIRPAVCFIGLLDGVLQGDRRRELLPVQDAALSDHSGQGSRRERAPAEPEEIDPISGIVNSYQFFVEIPYVPGESESECTPQQLERQEGLGANSVVIKRYLRIQVRIGAMAVQIDSFEEFKYVSTSILNGRITRSVRTDNDVLGHSSSLLRPQQS